jgi:DNA-binding CsgD family transcriptional regulator
MKHFDTVQWFLEQCQRPTELEALRGAFQKSLYTLGFRYYACGSHVDPLNPRQAVMLLNYPRQWVESYSELQLHCIDPVFQRADVTAAPFSWDAADFKTGMTRTQQRMLKEARRFGIEHGYTIPIHSPQSPAFVRASCSVIPDSASLHPYSYFAAQLMACYLFETAERLLAAITPAPKRPGLSARQRQCLELAAQGKSDWEIAKLLALAECTVHNYIENAKRRFAVATRMQAVVLALASHQISFGDVIRTSRGGGS